MKNSHLTTLGFSLIEVAITMGVMAFSFFTLLGLFPVALEQSRSCVNETRGAQLARMVFSTLTSEMFTSAECFGDSGVSPLDLSTLDSTKAAASGSSPVMTLYASYDGAGEPKITRAVTPPADAIYRMDLSFTPVTSQNGAANTVRGNSVRLVITSGSLADAAAGATPVGRTKVFQGVSFVGAFQRTASTQ